MGDLGQKDESCLLFLSLLNRLFCLEIFLMMHFDWVFRVCKICLKDPGWAYNAMGDLMTIR